MSEVRFRTWNNVVISHWTRAATTDGVSRLHRRAEQLHASVGGPVGLLLVVAEGLPPSPSESRSRALKMLRELGPNIAFVVVVLEGSGPLAAGVRAMFSILGSLARPSYPWRVQSRLEELFGWTPAGELAMRGALAEVGALLGELRAASHPEIPPRGAVASKPARKAASPSPADPGFVTCPLAGECPVLPEFTSASLRVTRALYCEGDHRRCARVELHRTGVVPPRDLLPNGDRLKARKA